MSTVTKIALGAVGVLVLILAAQFIYIHHQTEKLTSLNLQIKQVNSQLEQANRGIKTQAVIADVTDEVVTTATKRITTNTQKGVAIKAVVDNVTKKVANEKLSNTVASAVYINSMWDAFCTASPSDSACSARQPIN